MSNIGGLWWWSTFISFHCRLSQKNHFENWMGLYCLGFSCNSANTFSSSSLSSSSSSSPSLQPAQSSCARWLMYSVGCYIWCVISRLQNIDPLHSTPLPRQHTPYIWSIKKKWERNIFECCFSSRCRILTTLQDDYHAFKQKSNWMQRGSYLEYCFPTYFKCLFKMCLISMSTLFRSVSIN